MKDKTIVDWIEQQMMEGNLSLKEILEQAKEMEKGKLEDAWVEGVKNWNPSKTFEQYYQQTYGGNK